MKEKNYKQMETMTQKSNRFSTCIKKYFADNSIEKKPIAIAVSAGIDSMCILETILECYPKEFINCLHVDHGWHQDSNKAMRLLQDYCSKQEIKLHSIKYAPGEIKQDENSAREKRYEFFISKCQELGIKDLFLAHNSNDHAETILFRIFRGTSTSGLEGIKNQRQLNTELTLHRPLLSISRQEIEYYCNENKTQYYEDPSNSNTDYDRNKIRHKIIPIINEINPCLLDNLEKLSRIISEEQSYITKKSNEALQSLGPLPWDLNKFRSLEKALQRKILEETFTTSIRFCNQFLEAIEQGGYHKINYSKANFFVIKQKEIHKL